MELMEFDYQDEKTNEVNFGYVYRSYSPWKDFKDSFQ